LTELTTRLDGDGGILARYEVDFVKPIYAGDFVTIAGEIVHIGNTSRIVEFTVERYIDGSNVVWDPDADPKFGEIELIDPPELAVKGRAVYVVPKQRQRKPLEP
jgi:3-aminobutyryl-CoA ammonia-lyase